MPKPSNIANICAYGWYGGGGHQTPTTQPFSISGTDILNKDGKWISTIRAINGYKGHRLFLDSWIIIPQTTSTNQNFTIATNPTEQNFWFDEFWKLENANGIKPIICPTGLPDWLKVPGYSQRKSAPFDHSKEPTDPAAWADIAHLFYLLAKHLKEAEIDATLQGCNELDFRWNVQRILKAREWTVGQWEIIKAIRRANPDQEIMLGCTLTPTIEVFEESIATLKQLAGAEWENVKGKVIYTFNHYVRNLGGNQGAGECDTPESQWEQTYGFYSKINQRCEEEGIRFACTETGVSTSTSTSVNAKKQKCPPLQGISHEEAQGVYEWRHTLMFASFKNCVAVCFYHTKDGYEAEPFTYIGKNYDKDFGGKPDWSSKPGKIYYLDQQAKYGNLDVVSFTRSNGIYYCEFENGQVLHWTDKTNIGNVTPKPQLTTGTVPPPPPPPTNEKPMINYSLSSDRSNPKPLSGATVKPGNIFIFSDKPGSFILKNSAGTVVETQTENVPPYDLGGTDETQTSKPAKPVNLPAGSYVLDFQGEKVAFNVQDETTPPPPPPPTTKPLVTVNVEAPESVDLKVLVNGVQK